MDLGELREHIDTHFNLEELRTLCFDLGVDYDSLGGEGKAGKVRELVAYCERSTRLNTLVEKCVALRPNITWLQHDSSSNQKPPYRGLLVFREEDANHFFGRDTLITNLIKRLHHTRFLAVVGASGSGKSSLVRAGLMPALKRNRSVVEEVALPEGSQNWHYIAITPTNNPLEELALSLTEDLETTSITRELKQELAESDETLHLFIRKLLARIEKEKLVLIIDQFEELFTLCHSENQRRHFVNNLLTAIDNNRVVIVITLRADFYHHCGQYEALREALARHQEYIGPMTREELRQAIELPAQNEGYRLEPGLVDQLLRDVGADKRQESEPGALPLLSHALLETWKRRRQRTLTLEGYLKSGGVHEAVAKTAETVYQSLTPKQQAIARRIFLKLTELGEETQDTRRRASLSELKSTLGDSSVEDRVLKTLTDARLVITSENMAEVAHEALIRQWPMLHKWLDESRETLLARRRLAIAAREWETLEHDPGALYRGARLEQVMEWIELYTNELSQLEMSFLEASRKAVETEARKRREEQERLKKEKKRADDLLNVVIPLGIELVHETDFDRLLEKILIEAKAFCKANAGILYLRDDTDLRFVIVHDSSQNIAVGGTSGEDVTYPSLPLRDENGEPNYRNVATHAALGGISINITDPSQSTEYEFSALEKIGYQHATSILTIPLMNSQDAVIGVMQLIDAHDSETGEVISFDENLQQMMESLSSLSAAAFETIIRETNLRQENLQLRIEKEEVKRQGEVQEIVDSDFFQDLQAKAREMRSRRRS